jgi:hemoglobin
MYSIKFKSISQFLAASFFGFTMIFSGAASADESLFHRLGGAYGIAPMVDYLVELIYVNDGLNANPNLKAVHDNLESRKGFKVILTNWVMQETGGPKVYMQDEFGRGKSMKDAHPHLNISDREFDIIKTLCLATFYKYNVSNSDIDLLMDDLESYRKVIVTNQSEPAFKSRLVK